MEFPHLSLTNNVPLEAETQQIRGLVEAAGEEQTRIRAELAETREKEQQLSARDKELMRRIATLEGIVSSVRCIPPEILSHIFLLATPSNDTNTTAHCSNGPSLLRLSHICSRWRSIAHGTPKLWRVLQFKLTRYTLR
uniref:F-box domain-containing protein n=1 Tax=Mycena chlorophos TaxID=658473 RepID=A0ABQ0LNG0_MYCCL|nr:predicted protein [Mycena chlorophos]